MWAWSTILSSMMIHYLSTLYHLFWCWSWSRATVERILVCITRLVWTLFICHYTWVVISWLSIWQLILLIARAISWSLLLWLVRRYWATLGTMPVIYTRVWLLFFITSTIFVGMTRLVWVHRVINSIGHGTGCRLILRILGYLLLVLEQSVITRRIPSSI